MNSESKKIRPLRANDSECVLKRRLSRILTLSVCRKPAAGAEQRDLYFFGA
jgi:hypothetical protein